MGWRGRVQTASGQWLDLAAPADYGLADTYAWVVRQGSTPIRYPIAGLSPPAQPPALICLYPDHPQEWGRADLARRLGRTKMAAVPRLVDGPPDPPPPPWARALAERKRRLALAERRASGR